jgi:ParB family chromosome partitioning protein
MLEMALIENIQRENLNAIEVALSFQRMIDEVGLKQEELGDRVSKNRSTVTNYLRLLKLPPTIQASIRDGALSMGHARALVTVEDPAQQLYLHKHIIQQGLSVRKVEEMVRDLQKSRPKKEGKQPEPVSFQLQKIQDDLASKFSTQVKLKVGKPGQGYLSKFLFYQKMILAAFLKCWIGKNAEIHINYRLINWFRVFGDGAKPGCAC